MQSVWALMESELKRSQRQIGHVVSSSPSKLFFPGNILVAIILSETVDTFDYFVQYNRTLILVNDALIYCLTD